MESPDLKFKGPEKLGRVEYFQHLHNAKFCLAPRGESSWTLRFYESFFVVLVSSSVYLSSPSSLFHPFWVRNIHWWLTDWIVEVVFAEQECVPVILSDEAEFPFQNVIDYTQISIKWPSTRIGPELLEYLASIPGQIQCPWLLALLAESFIIQLNFLACISDAEVERMIAHGRQVRCLWAYAPESEPCSAMQGIMWELQRKVRQFHQSAETFWLHNGSIVNRDLVEFTNWKLPMRLPWPWSGSLTLSAFFPCMLLQFPYISNYLNTGKIFLSSYRL